jgi:Phytanoyl-CoA dioxygenase (PhyH)
VSAPSRTEFEERGFATVPGLLPTKEAQALREAIVALGGATGAPRDRAAPATDLSARLDDWEGVTRHTAFWSVIDHARLLDAVRALVGTEVRYLHNSEVHANNAGLLWHRDCLDQRAGVGADWDESVAPYRIVRACLYLQSARESGFRLGVVPGSHRGGTPTLLGRALDACAAAQQRLRLRRPWDPRRRRLPQMSLAPGWHGRLISARPIWLPVDFGDCVVIHQRLVHSASAVHGPQYAIYLSYGPDDVHAARFWQRQRDRPGRALSPPTPALAARLAAADLLLDADRPTRAAVSPT